MSDEKKTTSRKEKERTIRWEVQEFEYVEKTIDWYWIVGAIGIALAVVAYLVGNWSFAVLVIVSTVFLLYMSNHRPNVTTVTINTRSLTAGGKKYTLKDYEAYRIDTEQNKLLLKSKKTYAPLTVVPIPQEHSTEKLVHLLEDKIKLEEDEELHEPALEVIMHRLGF